jgi:hypothetical protein
MQNKKTAPAASGDPDLDLFGKPILPIRERRGRPSFGKNEENQRTVITLRGHGWTQKRIASYLGCDEKTLRKNFSRELAAGVDLLEAQALEVIVTKMRAGSLAAARKVLDLIHEGRAVPPPPKPDAPEDTAPQGKGAKAIEGAKKPGSTWGGILTKH